VSQQGVQVMPPRRPP